MDREAAHSRIIELRAILEENSRRYYVDNAPTMSDYEYDQLMHELEALEADFPEFASADSPAAKVGSDLEKGREFVQRAHRYPMLSLSNTYSIQEVEEFSARADKALGSSSFTYCCEPHQGRRRCRGRCHRECQAHLEHPSGASRRLSRRIRNPRRGADALRRIRPPE